MADKLLEQMFDFEVYPNWWCCVIGEYPQDDNVTEDLKDNFYVIDSDMPLAREKLFAIVNRPEYVNMGYNIKGYDNRILNGIHCGFSPHQLGILNELLIHPDRQYDSQEHLRIFPFTYKQYKTFNYQDFLDDNTGSLKEKEACMQLDIRETEVPFDKKDLTPEDKASIIKYCKHDVWSSMMFYKVIL